MSHRIEKINKLIMQILSADINKIFSEKFGMININSVVASPDFKSAKVYLSCLEESKLDELIINLQKKSFFLHRLLNKKLQIKFVPKLIFCKDQSQKNIDKIEELLTKIGQENIL